MNKTRFFDIAVIGLALFAMYFGAGNLIFPPYLGTNAGTEWFIGFMAFFIADMGLALVAIFSMIRSEKTAVEELTGKLGKAPSVIVNSSIFLCFALFAAPRTAATAFEMGISPLFPSLNTWVFGAIYFALVLLFSFRKGKVIDIIGKYLTPIMVICILVLLVVGVVNPIGTIDTPAKINVVKEGIISGYQTMDVLFSTTVILLIITTAKEKGYTKENGMLGMVLKAGIFAAVVLFIVYGGLAFLGATTSGGGYEEYNQAGLVVAIVQQLVGGYGVIILAVVVSFACLTSAIGQISVGAAYFSDLSNGKVQYKHLIVLFVVLAFIISNIGLSAIINVASPVLTLVYPVVFVMVICNFFYKQIQNDNIYKFAAIFAFLTVVCEVATGYGAPLGFVMSLPLASYGLEWIIPAIIGGIIGKFIPSAKKA